MSEFAGDEKLKNKLRLMDQGSAPSINLEVNLNGVR
jgi:hypothetical protein